MTYAPCRWSKRLGEKVAVIQLKFHYYSILYILRFKFYLRDPLEDFVEPLLLFERRSVCRGVTNGRLKGLQVVKDFLNAADNLLHRLLTDPADRGCVDLLALLLLAWRWRQWLLLLLLVRRTNPAGAVSRRSRRRCRPRRWRRHRGRRRGRLTLSLLQLLLHRWRTVRHLRAGGHARGRGGCEGSRACGRLQALRRLLLVILRT